MGVCTGPLADGLNVAHPGPASGGDNGRDGQRGTHSITHWPTDGSVGRVAAPARVTVSLTAHADQILLSGRHPSVAGLILACPGVFDWPTSCVSSIVHCRHYYPGTRSRVRRREGQSVNARSLSELNGSLTQKG